VGPVSARQCVSFCEDCPLLGRKAAFQQRYNELYTSGWRLFILDAH
jgi:hypothetical protein